MGALPTQNLDWTKPDGLTSGIKIELIREISRSVLIYYLGWKAEAVCRRCDVSLSPRRIPETRTSRHGKEPTIEPYKKKICIDGIQKVGILACL